MKRVEPEGILWHTLALLALIFQPLIFYRRHLISLVSHIPFDIVGFHLPLATFMERAARQGIWPFWDPFNYCGVPIHADIQAQLFYPPTWLTIGGLGAYLLIRRFGCPALVAFFGATVFQIGPFFASQAEHFGSICAAAWFPLILLSLFNLADGFK